MKQETTAKHFYTFSEMLSQLQTEADCREYLESILWEQGPICPHCGTQDEKHYRLKQQGEFKGLYKCKDCKLRFTVKVGTMFEGSNAPLRKWFIAIYIFSSHKKGISSIQLAKDLGITQKTAWYMLHRIRHSFRPKNVRMSGFIQVDETFIGGKAKNKHSDKRTRNAQGRSLKDKTPVFGILSNNSQVYTEVVPSTGKGHLQPIIKRIVEKGSLIVTDEWHGYNGLDKDYKQSVIFHANKEYVRGAIHNNSIEGFWGLLKRGILGIYHHTSPQHLQKYCDEFGLRYNTRKMDETDRFDHLLANPGSRLKYKELIALNK